MSIKDHPSLSQPLAPRIIPLVVGMLLSFVAGAQLPTTFQKVELVTGLKNAVNIEFAPDGRIFLVDRFGELFIYKPNTQVTLSAGTIDVFHDMEEGLLSVAFDPDFTTNNFIYLHYSDPVVARNKVSRFTMNGDLLDLTTEVVVIEWDSDRNGYYHAAGDMDFDAEGNLFIAIGDNTNHTAYAPLNEGNSNQSAERTSSNTNDLRGKILRIRVNADGTYTIPEGNLFPNAVGGRPEIYVMGARNPYKIFVDKTNTNWLFWGEVGPDANVESEMGPEGMDEINVVKTAGNYGWPYFSGKNEPYRNTYVNPNFYYDHTSPVNLSKWNTGPDNLPPARASWLEFFHACFLAGPRYYFDPAISNPKKLPADFHGAFFYYDFNTSKIWVVHMDNNGNILSNQQFAAGIIGGAGFIDLKVGPDGQLYILEYGAGCCPSNVGSGKLVRVDYTGIDDNKPPVVELSASAISGPLPLTVNFSSAGTMDLDGNALTFEWDFQSDEITDSTDPNPTFEFTEKAVYNVLLRVIDSEGAISTKTVTIYPGNTEAAITFDYPPDGAMFSWNDHVAFEVTVADQEDGTTADGTIPCEEISIIPAFGHLTHSHDGLTINQCDGVFRLDPTGHDAQGQDDIYYVFKANYTDYDGLTTFQQITIHPKIMEAEFYDAQNNTTLIDNVDPFGGAVYSVRALSNNSYIMFDGRNLVDIHSISCRLSSVTGGVIEVRADAPNGPLLSTINVPVTGSADRFAFTSAPIADPGGKHDLYFIFKKTGATNFLDLNYVEFVGHGTSNDNTPPDVYSVQVISKNQVSIRFDEALNVATAESIGNYSINNGITIHAAEVLEDKKTVRLTVSDLSVGVENSLTITNVSDVSDNPVLEPIVKTCTMHLEFMRVNAGGPQLELGGAIWKANQFNEGGAIASNPNLAIKNTDDDVLYQSELNGNLRYSIPVSNGTYDLKLHFAELVYKNPGQRVFNISIENNQFQLQNYDIFSKVGHAAAIVETFNGVIVKDSYLDIILTGVTNKAKISAIEVLYGTQSLPPKITILNPEDNLTVVDPFTIGFQVENWHVHPGSSHIKWLIDGNAGGSLHNMGPLTLSGISPGTHTIQLVLANADGSSTEYADEVEVIVAPADSCIENPFPLQWESHIIGPDIPYRAPHVIPADIDGDGFKDILMGGWWYQNPGTPKGIWKRNNIGTPLNNLFLVHDLDSDGDLDIVGTQGAYLSTQLAWAQNDGKGNFIIRTNIPQAAGFPPGSANDNVFLAGVATGNFNNVANIQIALVWNGSETSKAPVKLLTVPADPVNQAWTVADIAPNAVGEGIVAVDIDGDGDLDLSQAKNWLRNDNGSWTTVNTSLALATYYEHHAIRDFDRDGLLDGVLTQIGENQEIAWFNIPPNPANPWTKVTLDGDIDSGLSLDVADLDFDGDLDVIVGEWKGAKRLLAFENDLCNSGTWIKHVIHPGGAAAPDHHNGAQVADLDNDGDLDIISVGWDKRTPRIYINNRTSHIGNQPPVVVNAIEDLSAQIGVTFSFTFSENTFSDPDGDLLTYSATQVNGAILPAWLTFNNTTRAFGGQPPSNGALTLHIRLTATDPSGGSVHDDFAIVFPNQSPVVANPIPDQSSNGGEPFSYTFPINTFSDPNGDVLTYMASLSDDTPLPPWLSFEGTTRTFNATPSLDDAGIFEIRVTASDASTSVSDVFVYTVVDPTINYPPVVNTQIPALSAIAGSEFSYTFPDDTFTDPNADALNYTATQENGNSLPAWLSFNPATRTFSGTPPIAAIGSLTILLSASDGGEAVSLSITLTIESGANIRINSGGPGTPAFGVTFDADKNFSGGGVYTNNNIADIAGTTFDDLYKSERNNALSYSIPVQPGTYLIRLHFAEIFFGATGGSAGGVGKRIFNVVGEGQPLLTNFDIYAEAGAMRALVKEVEVSVTDGTLNLNFIKVVQNPKVSAIEVIASVPSGNAAPVVGNNIPDQLFTVEVPFTFVVPANTFSDPDGDALTVSTTLANNDPLPAWIAFDSNSITFNANPELQHAGVYQIKVTASDGEASVDDIFEMVVQSPDVNNAPVVSNPIADQTLTAGEEFVFVLAANVFADPDGDQLEYSAMLSDDGSLPGWLNFNNTTATFQGIAPSEATTYSIKVIAGDGELEVEDVFDIIVNENGSPVVDNAIPDQVAEVGSAFTFTFAANTFTDPDADPMTYTAASEGGGDLPSWLSFDGPSRTFSGTPTVGDVGNVDVVVTASNASGSVSDEFVISVAETPVFERYINSGGPAVTAYGKSFEADNNFSGGKVYTNNMIGDVGETDADQLYRSERNNVFGYQVAVPPGTYTVRLHFAEVFFGATGGGVGGAGQRVFNVTAEGLPVLTNLDIFAEVGAMTALIKEFDVDVFDGTLNINFIKVVQNPKVSGIEIVAKSILEGQPPSLGTPIPDQFAISGIPFNLTFNSNAFTDPDGDPLTYSATLSNGNPLPDWLAFSAASRNFSGTPETGDVGSVNIRVTAFDGNASASDIFQLTVNEGDSHPDPVLINAGGQAVVVGAETFAADTYFSGGSTYTNGNIVDISGTDADALYRSERYKLNGYNIPLPAGTYILRLHFAEIFFGATGGGVGAPGKRVFSVTAEGAPILTNFDIYAEAGAMAAVVKEFELEVTDGVLNLSFIKIVENTKVNAIEIRPVTTSALHFDGTARISDHTPGTAIERNEMDAYPNPFNQYTTILYSPVESGAADLDVVAANGTLVEDIFSGNVEAGSLYRFDVDANEMASGVYFARLRTSDRVVFLKLLLSR